MYDDFGDDFIFQQDNSSPHASAKAIDFIKENVPTLLEWPSRSPDLSPIEHLWSYLKDRIRSMTFTDEDTLFDVLSVEWNHIPREVIEDTYTSFSSRCKVCYDINGAQFNNHWRGCSESLSQIKKFFLYY